MKWLRTIAAEFFGLFVDDGSMAVVVVLWLGVCGVLLAPLAQGAAWPAALLFAGLVLILAESVVRRAGRQG